MATSTLHSRSKRGKLVENAANSDQLSAAELAYAAIADKVRGGDPDAAAELGTLRIAIGKESDLNRQGA